MIANIEDSRIERIPYTPDLLPELLAIAGRQLAHSGRNTGPHPGDFAHAIAGGLRTYKRSDVVYVWGDRGQAQAFGIVWPKWSSVDMVVPHDVSDADHDWIVDDAIERARTNGTIEFGVYSGSERLDAALDERGFGQPEAMNDIGVRELARLPEVPDIGYEIRGADRSEVESIAAAHRSAFGSTWTTEEYGRYMDAHPYQPDRELVAVTDDGQIVGFAVVWIDEASRFGHFEPVGVHTDHQRKGIGRALLFAGMHKMRDEGMERASVLYDIDSPNRPFYESVGFAAIGTVALRVRNEEEK